MTGVIPALLGTLVSSPCKFQLGNYIKTWKMQIYGKDNVGEYTALVQSNTPTSMGKRKQQQNPNKQTNKNPMLQKEP